MTSDEQSLSWPVEVAKRLGRASLLVISSMTLGLLVLNVIFLLRVPGHGFGDLFSSWALLLFIYFLPFVVWVMLKESIYRKWGSNRGKTIGWQHAALVDTIMYLVSLGGYLLANCLFNEQQMGDIPSLLWEANVFLAFVPLVFLVQQFWPPFRRMRGK